MDKHKKLNLEWIPNAYLVIETIVPKTQTLKAVTGTHPIVKSTGLYKKKSKRADAN